MYRGEKGDCKMPLGITREEAAYILALIECDIIDAGGLKLLKNEWGTLIDFEGIIRQLEIIMEIGESSLDRKDI